MKRLWMIGIAGLAAAGLGYYFVYADQTAKLREMEQCPEPALAWLKVEYRLSDAEFKRVSELHDAYLPGCMERCRKIDAANAELGRLIASSTNVTPGIVHVMDEAAKLRAECHAEMLKHFYEVSRAMPPEQGKRYLEWVCAQTLTPQHFSMARASSPASAHEQSGH